ncbi:hypothetical protein [Curtobacterium sp. RRHDQ10]|uniref:hypothetical protein n=1 Tax=Curtobacterium phyllosphaerae TaxID=3413379 RepID=UPI003BF1AE7A
MARRLFVPTLVAVVLLLSGCTATGVATVPAGGDADVRTASRGVAPESGKPDASASAAAAARERQVLRLVDTIQLDAEQLMLTGRHDALRTASMRDAKGTVALLTRLLGRPRTTTTTIGDGGHCVPASTSYTWGGAIRVVDLAQRSGVGNDYDVRILAASVRSRSGAEIRLQGPDGVAVGQDIAARIGATPDTDKESYGSDGAENWQVVLERGWSSGSGAGDAGGVNGVSAITTGTTVAVLGSPMPVHSAADC